MGSCLVISEWALACPPPAWRGDYSCGLCCTVISAWRAVGAGALAVAWLVWAGACRPGVRWAVWSVGAVEHLLSCLVLRARLIVVLPGDPQRAGGRYQR